MKKRFFTTGIVLLIFVLLLIYANKYESEEIPEPGKDKPVQLAKITASDVESITWKSEGQPDIKVESRKKGTEQTFVLTQPRSLPADDDEINGIIRSFNDLKSEFVIASQPSDTTPYGLTAKSPTLTFKTATETFTYKLGDNAPVGGSVYFQKEGDRAVYFVPSYVGSAFRKTVDDLRSKKIFHDNFGDVATVTVELNGQKIALVRDKGLEWKITSPRELPADSIEVSSLISGVQNLKVSRFIDDERAAKEDFGFATSSFKVTLDTASGQLVLISGRTDGSETYVKRQDSPAVYAVYDSSLALLRKDFNKLRSKELGRIDETRMTEVLLHHATQTLTLKPASDTWVCTNTNNKIETSKVHELGLAFMNNHVKAFLPWSDREKEGLGKLENCSWYELKIGTDTRKVYFGKGNGTDISIILEGQEEVFQVPIQMYDTFKKLVDVAAAPPPPPPPASATHTPDSSTHIASATQTKSDIASISANINMTASTTTAPANAVTTNTVSFISPASAPSAASGSEVTSSAAGANNASSANKP